MSRLLLSAVAGVAVVASAAPASAQVYAGIGQGSFQTDLAHFENAESDGFLARIGAKFNAFIGVEVEQYRGRSRSNESPLTGFNFHYGLTEAEGAFAVGWAPIPFVGDLDLFARAGYAHLKADDGLSGMSTSGEGFAYGAGAQFGFSIVRVRGEYTRYEIDDVPTDGFTATALLQF